MSAAAGGRTLPRLLERMTQLPFPPKFVEMVELKGRPYRLLGGASVPCPKVPGRLPAEMTQLAPPPPTEKFSVIYY